MSAQQNEKANNGQYAGLRRLAMEPASLVGRLLPEDLAELRVFLAERDGLAAVNRQLLNMLETITFVAIAMLFEHHRTDVLRSFTIAELQRISDKSAGFISRRVEDIYREAFDAVVLASAPGLPAELSGLRRSAIENLERLDRVGILDWNEMKPILHAFVRLVDGMEIARHG